MTDDRLRVGIIGANADRSWAANSHLPALQKLPDFELAAVCTTREESARESAERFGARLAFHDYREMLDRDDIDAVAVSVRVPRHYEPTMAALEAGKHVYTEWPLGANLDEAKEMASFARAKGVKTMVGLQERRVPLYLRLKELVDEGYFGELLSCMVVWSGSGILDRSSEQRWRADDASGANTLTIGFGHTVDPVCLALGDFTEVSAISRPQVPQWVESDTGELVDVTAPDTVMMCGTTSSGAAVSGVSLAVPWHGSGFQLEIYGRKATAIISTSENDVLGAQRLMVGAPRRRARRGAHTRTAVAGARVGDAERRLLHRPDVEALRGRDPGGTGVQSRTSTTRSTGIAFSTRSCGRHRRASGRPSDGRERQSSALNGLNTKAGSSPLSRGTALIWRARSEAAATAVLSSPSCSAVSRSP